MSQIFCEFIEFVVHNSSFRFCPVVVNRACADATVCPRRLWAQSSEFAETAISKATYCLSSSHFNALAIGFRATVADGAGAKGIVVANAAAALGDACTTLAGREALYLSRFGTVRQPEAGQRHARETNAEFLQRRAPRDGLGHRFG
jgi:hypothetical protein